MQRNHRARKDKSWFHFINLKKESIVITFLINNISTNRLSSWHKVSLKLPNIYNLYRKCLILVLPTKANLKTYNIIKSSTCDLCIQKSETQHHIVSNCQTAAIEKRYTWRHNSVLYTITNYMSTIGHNNSKVDDIEGFPSTGQLFASPRPDLVMVFGDVYYVIEQAVSLETNLIKSNEYKRKKHDDICREAINK